LDFREAFARQIITYTFDIIRQLAATFAFVLLLLASFVIPHHGERK